MKKITLAIFIIIYSFSANSQEFDGVALGKPIEITLKEFEAKGYFAPLHSSPNIVEYIINEGDKLDTVIDVDTYLNCCDRRIHIVDTQYTYTLDGKFNNQKVFLSLTYSSKYKTVFQIDIEFVRQPNWQLLEQQYNTYLSKLTNKYGSPSLSSKDFSFYYALHGGGDKYKAVKNGYCEYAAAWSSSGVAIQIVNRAAVCISYNNFDQFKKSIEKNYNRAAIDAMVLEFNEHKRKEIEDKRIKDSIASVKDSLHFIECKNPFENFIYNIVKWESGNEFIIRGKGGRIKIKSGCDLPELWGIIFDSTENLNKDSSFVLRFSTPIEYTLGNSGLNVKNKNSGYTPIRGNTPILKLNNNNNLNLNLDINKEYFFKVYYLNNDAIFIYSNTVSFKITEKSMY